MFVTRGGRGGGGHRRPTVACRVVARAVVQKATAAGSAPDDHLTAGPHRRVTGARGGRTGDGHRRPTVAHRIVAPAVVQIGSAVSAPDDHLAARPHRRVRVAHGRNRPIVALLPEIRTHRRPDFDIAGAHQGGVVVRRRKHHAAAGHAALTGGIEIRRRRTGGQLDRSHRAIGDHAAGHPARFHPIRHHRVAHGGNALVGRQLLAAVGAVVKPDPQPHVAVVEHARGDRCHVVAQ